MFLRYELCTFGAENFTLLDSFRMEIPIYCVRHVYVRNFWYLSAVYCLDETFKTVCNCMKLHSTLWNSMEIRTEYVRYVYVILLILYSCIRYMYTSWTNYTELHRTVWNSIKNLWNWMDNSYNSNINGIKCFSVFLSEALTLDGVIN